MHFDISAISAISKEEDKAATHCAQRLYKENCSIFRSMSSSSVNGPYKSLGRQAGKYSGQMSCRTWAMPFLRMYRTPGVCLSMCKGWLNQHWRGRSHVVDMHTRWLWIHSGRLSALLKHVAHLDSGLGCWQGKVWCRQIMQTFVFMEDVATSLNTGHKYIVLFPKCHLLKQQGNGVLNKHHSHRSKQCICWTIELCSAAD